MRGYFIFLNKMDSSKAVHDYFCRMLDMPKYYGRNLDALFDVLTDISEETVFYLAEGGQKETLPDEAEKLLRVLENAAEENRHIQICKV